MEVKIALEADGFLNDKNNTELDKRGDKFRFKEVIMLGMGLIIRRSNREERKKIQSYLTGSTEELTTVLVS